ncbi:MAG: aminotransferase class V-fold PLP-dependent enzyme [Candidatus Hydrogenedentota bacterium]
MNITEMLRDESARQHHFPVTAERIFLAHAGVTALPRAATDAITEYLAESSADAQENKRHAEMVGRARELAARMLGAQTREIALIGPTSLGLNLVAQGLPWEKGDEAVYYPGDYPANVYPWLNLKSRGVAPVALQPPEQGVITWEVIEQALSDRTRLVALASCNFLSGYRIDIDGIGRRLGERGILFSVDGIQTVGAFPMSVEHVDFLSADSHKWMLGPCGAGIFYVKESRQDLLRPSVLGSWNVVSPNFIAQDEIRFQPGARRYESGTLNLPGVVGMAGGLELLLDAGIEAVAERILSWRETFLDAVRPMGWRPGLAEASQEPSARSGIIAIAHPRHDPSAIFEKLKEHGVRLSLRQTADGTRYLRFSPHFYNPLAELDRVVEILKQGE